MKYLHKLHVAEGDTTVTCAVAVFILLFVRWSSCLAWLSDVPLPSLKHYLSIAGAMVLELSSLQWIELSHMQRLCDLGLKWRIYSGFARTMCCILVSLISGICWADCRCVALVKHMRGTIKFCNFVAYLFMYVIISVIESICPRLLIFGNCVLVDRLAFWFVNLITFLYCNSRASSDVLSHEGAVELCMLCFFFLSISGFYSVRCSACALQHLLVLCNTQLCGSIPPVLQANLISVFISCGSQCNVTHLVVS